MTENGRTKSACSSTIASSSQASGEAARPGIQTGSFTRDHRLRQHPRKAACGGWPVAYSRAVSSNEISAAGPTWTPDLGGEMPPRPGIRTKAACGKWLVACGGCWLTATKSRLFVQHGPRISLAFKPRSSGDTDKQRLVVNACYSSPNSLRARAGSFQARVSLARSNVRSWPLPARTTASPGWARFKARAMARTRSGSSR